MLYLIEHPNFSSANNSISTLENPKHLQKKTERVLAGLPVNGYRFAPNTAWCEWALANGRMPTGETEEEEVEEEVAVKEDETSYGEKEDCNRVQLGDEVGCTLPSLVPCIGRFMLKMHQIS